MLEKIKTLIKENKFKEVHKELIDLDASDIAEILEKLHEKEIIRVFNLLPKDLAANTFSQMDSHYQHLIIKYLTENEAAEIIDKLATDDAADVMEEMPSNVVTKILEKTSPEKRKNINTLLHYEEDSAGSIMKVEYLAIIGNLKIEDAIKEIKLQAKDKVTVDYCYILDEQRKLLGTISLRQILLSSYDQYVYDIMKQRPKYVTTNTDQEEVAHKMQKYDINTIAVVDSEKRLVGIITIDDIVDVLEDETTEDIEKMAAIRPSDKPYMSMNTFEIWRKRIPWLLLLMISATFTSKIIQHYENALSKFVILTSFIPMFMDTAGNAGGQSSVTIIRGLSLNEISFRDIFKIMFKEFKVAILVGISLAIANGIKLLFIDGIPLKITAVVCITLLCTIIIAKIIGCTLPLIAKKLKFDPAVMASPFITTIVDAVSLIVFFQVASTILHI